VSVIESASGRARPGGSAGSIAVPGGDPGCGAGGGRVGAAAEVEAALAAGAAAEGSGLLEEVALFDVYTGEQAGEGNKSLAYTLRFRAPDRTLTDEEVTAARGRGRGRGGGRAESVPCCAERRDRMPG
jgi:hypothetical protein